MDPVRTAAQLARNASYGLSSVDLGTRNEALLQIAEALKASTGEIVDANRKDLAAAKAAELPPAMIKRLRYDEEKIEESVRSIHSLMEQEDVVGKLLSRTELDDGLVLDKISVPIGVIGVVFESRPDALMQISCLCLRSGNAVLLKGGVEARGPMRSWPASSSRRPSRSTSASATRCSYCRPGSSSRNCCGTMIS